MALFAFHTLAKPRQVKLIGNSPSSFISKGLEVLLLHQVPFNPYFTKLRNVVDRSLPLPASFRPDLRRIYDTILNCEFSSIRDTDVFLGALSSEYCERWRNFGLMWVYIVVNKLGAILVYWLVRVLQDKRKIKSSKEMKKDE